MHAGSSPVKGALKLKEMNMNKKELISLIEALEINHEVEVDVDLYIPENSSITIFLDPRDSSNVLPNGDNEVIDKIFDFGKYSFLDTLFEVKKDLKIPLGDETIETIPVGSKILISWTSLNSHSLPLSSSYYLDVIIGCMNPRECTADSGFKAITIRKKDMKDWISSESILKIKSFDSCGYEI